MSQHKSTAIVIAAGVCFGVLLGPTPAASADIQPHAAMLRYPDVSRTQIVLVYANDLWLVSRDGGQATPLASPPGPGGFQSSAPTGKRSPSSATTTATGTCTRSRAGAAFPSG